VGVSDTDTAISFFTERLGFEVRLDVPFGERMRWVEVAPPGATTSVALLSAGGPQAGGDTGIRFAVTDAASTRADVVEACVHAGDLIEFGGAPPMFTFTDPDGNVFYAVEDASLR